MTSSISVTVDTSKWEKEYKYSLNKTVIAQDYTIKTVAKRLKERIESYTPIGDPSLWHWPAPHGYTPGALRNGWKLIYNGKEISIKNELPYALRVETGWSTQAPEGMMRRATLEYPILINRTATEYKVS